MGTNDNTVMGTNADTEIGANTEAEVHSAPGPGCTLTRESNRLWVQTLISS